MPSRIVFLGSKPIGYHCLQFLLEHQQELDIRVIGLCTRLRKEFGGDNDLGRLAGQYQVPVLQSLDDIPECEIIYSVQHHELLKARHIEQAGQIAVNLHLAPLPEYRGCNQFSFAIMDDAREFGATIHEIDTRIDHGAVLFEHRFSVPEQSWVNELYELTYNAAIKLFHETIEPLVKGRYTRTPQSELLATRRENLHFREEIQQLKEIDLDQPAALIEKTLRATYMPGFEPPYAMVGGKKVYFRTE